MSSVADAGVVATIFAADIEGAPPNSEGRTSSNFLPPMLLSTGCMVASHTAYTGGDTMPGKTGEGL